MEKQTIVTDPLIIVVTITVALACTAVHFLAEPLRWRLYAPQRGSLKRHIHVFNLAALVSHLAPLKLGLPARLYLMRRALSYDLSSAGKLSLLDSLFYYGAWGTAAAAAVAALDVSEQIDRATSLIAAVIVSTLLAFAAIFLRRKNRVNTATANARLENARLSWLWRPRLPISTLVAVGGVLLVDWSVQIMRHVLLLSLLGQSLDLLVVASIVSIAVFAGFLSLMPLGLGGYDATLTLLLASHGLALDTALAIPLMNRLLSLTIAIALGMTAFSALGFKGRLWDWLQTLLASR